MKALLAIAVCMLSLLAFGISSARDESIMNGGIGGMWIGDWIGGYEGILGWILMVIVVTDVVALIVKQKMGK